MDEADRASLQAERDEARAEGKRARKLGMNRNSCPYEADEPQGAAWFDGWDREHEKMAEVIT